jgi:hypothetical protein
MEREFQLMWARHKRSHDRAATVFFLCVFALRESRRFLDPGCEGVRAFRASIKYMSDYM